MAPLENRVEQFQGWRNNHPLVWTVILIALLVILVVLYFVIKANKIAVGYPEFIPLSFILALLVPLFGAIFNLWKFYREKNFSPPTPNFSDS